MPSFHWLKTWGAPKYFYQRASHCYPWMLCLSLVLLCIGTYAGLVLAPADYQQGDAFSDPLLFMSPVLFCHWVFMP